MSGFEDDHAAPEVVLSEGPAPTAPEGTADLGRDAARGAAVVSVGQGVRLLLQTVSVVVLARLLDPTDYGLVAMGLVVVGVGEIFRDFGLSSAAVQTPKLTKVQRDNLFWLNSAIGVLLGVIVFAIAPLVAGFFGRQEVTQIVRAVSGVFLLNGFAAQYRASLMRSLRFGLLAVADTVSVLVALSVAVIAALGSWGYWALVLQVLVQAAVALLVVLFGSLWWPGRPRRENGMAPLLKFGWHIVGAQLLSFAGNNADTVLIGARLGATSLGLYNRAYQLLMRPLAQLLAPSSNVAIPVLSRLHDDDARLQRFILRGQTVLGYTAVVGLGVVAAASTPITRVALGPKWLDAAPLIALLAVAGGLQTLSYVGYWVYVSRGLTKQLRRYSLFSALLKVLCVVVGSRWGVLGVASGMAVAPAIAWPASIWWLSRFAPIPIRDMYRAAARILLVALVCAAVTLVVVRSSQSWAPWVTMMACVPAVLVSLGVMVAVARPIRNDVLSVLDIARKVRR